MESEKRTQETEKRIGDVLTELSFRQEILHKQSQEQRQESRAQIKQMEARFYELLQMITAMSLQNQMKNGDGTKEEVPAGKEDNEVAEVAEKERVGMAALHLENKALQWHRSYVNLKGEKAYKDWSEYIRAIAARFGAQVYEDSLSDLRNLRLVSSFQAYMDAFDELCPRTSIRED